MKILATMSLLLALPACALPQKIPPRTVPKTVIIQSVDTTSDKITPILLRKLSLQARTMLESIPVNPYCVHRVRGKNIAEGRQIAMTFYSPKNRQLETALIGLCYENPEQLTPLTPGLTIKWISGRGITRYVFSANRPPEHLLWIDGKHWMNESNKGEYYFPVTHDFFLPEFIDDGAQFLISQIDDAKKELSDAKVMSRAIHGQRLGDIFPAELLFNLAINEQSDDEEFTSKCPDPQSLPPDNRIFANCPEYAASKVLIHYARNHENAFRFVKSKAGASGALQFMPKTYAYIVRQYPDVQLDVNFEHGTSDLKNLIKAAMCLLDDDLLILNRGIRNEFFKNPRTGGMYLMAAYNGGISNAERLWQSLHAIKPKSHKKKFRKQNKTVAKETAGYVSKYIALWNVIDDMQLKK